VRAVWYDRQGPASDVLQIGELPDQEPGPGEVRVRVRYSGVNPGDTKKRRGWLARQCPTHESSRIATQLGSSTPLARVSHAIE
jgi:NADPH:quinone reductase-like Zn-dependent oxidoreductase